MLNDIDDRLCGLGDVRWKKFLETANWLCHFHMGQAGRLLIKFRIIYITSVTLWGKEGVR